MRRFLNLAFAQVKRVFVRKDRGDLAGLRRNISSRRQSAGNQFAFSHDTCVQKNEPSGADFGYSARLVRLQALASPLV
jgi:hypothetical protein